MIGFCQYSIIKSTLTKASLMPNSLKSHPQSIGPPHFLTIPMLFPENLP